MKKRFRIILLFNANKIYDRQVIEGIGEYLQASQCEWDVFLEEDFVTQLDNVDAWEGDGIIADFDNPEVVRKLVNVDIPVVAVGGSYQDINQYPNVPYVATDNYNLVLMAFTHLKEKGLENFAFYGIPTSSWKRWAHERELAFTDIIDREGYNGSIYRGKETSVKTWQYDMNRLADWLQKLPTPVGIISVTDARARHILQMCEQLEIMVPDKISVIGIDNEEIARYLNRVSLTSVGQGCKEMGYRAAKFLHKRLENEKPHNSAKPPRILISPTQVYPRHSTDFRALKDPYVIQAMHYIRHNACKGIKVESVLSYVGISRSNLEVRFKEELGHSIHKEIHNSKLEHACSLLTNTSLPISEIAELCGYPSLQYIYSVFKKDLGKTPKEFRNNNTYTQST
ncbi:XylR family transcriptional regulator [Vibrio nigripulchritudo]|uniref:XylR family transcriptional regulator n=1 Tax=Vibrio nigripulchritudo TaxID=28173 RepID=UPI0003B2110A|nr:DNA-binding transcriptional regulator [Vibrio nigripulchritudo]CCN69269.1 DNA-binding transcriptional activator,xylose-binding [Vibrio nigripulchritudo SFn118]